MNQQYVLNKVSLYRLCIHHLTKVWPFTGTGLGIFLESGDSIGYFLEHDCREWQEQTVFVSERVKAGAWESKLKARLLLFLQVVIPCTTHLTVLSLRPLEGDGAQSPPSQ